MEIQELIFFYLHETTKTIEVQFRLIIDSEEEFRTDMIDLSESTDFGFDLITEDYSSYDEDEENEEDYFWLDSPTIDEDNLISFLNEYYVVYPNKLPKPELI
jgi:hypothetical protein